MKWLIKLFFKTLRIVLIPFMLLWEKITTTKGIVRPQEAQRMIDQRCQKLALYQFKTCPFCIKVRREINRLSLNIPLLDAQNQPQHRAALLQGGGQVKVPCLKITNKKGKTEWMYESADIIRYLKENFT